MVRKVKRVRHPTPYELRLYAWCLRKAQSGKASGMKGTRWFANDLADREFVRIVPEDKEDAVIMLMVRDPTWFWERLHYVRRDAGWRLWERDPGA